MDVEKYAKKDFKVLLEYLADKHTELVTKAAVICEEAKALVVDGVVTDELQLIRLIAKGTAINEEAGIILKEITCLTGWEINNTTI